MSEPFGVAKLMGHGASAKQAVNSSARSKQGLGTRAPPQRRAAQPQDRTPRKVGSTLQPILATIHDEHDPQEALFRGDMAGDLSVSLSCGEGQGQPLSFRYEEFTPFSFTRPWRLEPARLSAVHVEASAGGGLRVLARAGPFALEDLWRWTDGRLWVVRRWTYRGSAPCSGVTLGTRLPTDSGPEARVTLPGVSYNGNPSADPGRLVPHLTHDGGPLVVEEHRLPIPAVNIEWASGDHRVALTVLAIPARLTLPGVGADHWWTLGGTYGVRGFDVLSLSGVLALNGARDTRYASENEMAAVPGQGYLTLQPGDACEKTLVLDLRPCRAAGHGFRHLLPCAWSILRPQVRPALGPEETITLKAGALRARWREHGSGGGFLVAPATRAEGNIYDRPPGFLFGWTGQSLRLAWCALAIGLLDGDASWERRGRAVLDDFAAAPECAGAPGLRPMYHAWDEGRWYADGRRQNERFSSRMVGEALSNLADCLLLLRVHRRPAAVAWRSALRAGLTFLASPDRTNAEGVFPVYFDRSGKPADALTSAAGLPAVVALLRGAEILADTALATRALALLARYHDLFARDFARPFSRSTLDAACEDKEAGLYFFLAAYHAFRLTGAASFAEAARVAAEWAATFVYCWDVPWPKGSACALHGFRTTGWPSVSVQNHHIDVFFFPWEVHDLGQRLGDPLLLDLGLAVLQAWTHGIARHPGDWGYPTPGEQGEAFFQTNWCTTVSGRGGFNPWNPSWITGMVLQANLRFAHAGLGG